MERQIVFFRDYSSVNLSRWWSEIVSPLIVQSNKRFFRFKQNPPESSSFLTGRKRLHVPIRPGTRRSLTLKRLTEFSGEIS